MSWGKGKRGCVRKRYTVVCGNEGFLKKKGDLEIWNYVKRGMMFRVKLREILYSLKPA